MTEGKFDWLAYLELAKELANTPQERHRRTAISRAYYAAFNHAKSYVERSTSTAIPRDGAAHGAVPLELRRMRPAHSKEASKLEQLKQLRIWADYRASLKQNLEGEVAKALAHADTIISGLR